MLTRSRDEFRPSVKRVDCDKTEDRSVQIFIPYARTFSLGFWEKQWLMGATPSTWNFGSTGSRWSEIADFEPMIACTTSAVTPSEKNSINTNRMSTMRFPVSLRWSSYVAPKPSPLPKEGLKCKTVVFRLKSHFAWRKSATKFLCVKTVSNKIVRLSLAWQSVQKWLVGWPVLPEILSQTDCVGVKSPIFDLFSLLALQP